MEKAGLTAKWEDRGRAKWEAQVRTEGAKTAWEEVVSLMKQGYTVEQLERMAPSGINKR
jgi:hypothetical protein